MHAKKKTIANNPYQEALNELRAAVPGQQAIADRAYAVAARTDEEGPRRGIERVGTRAADVCSPGNLESCHCLLKEGALTQDSPGSSGSTESRSPEGRITEMRTQNSSNQRFDCRIDAASLAVLTDLGMSKAQIARYRRRWCRPRQSTAECVGARTNFSPW
jgi:hypothetical protein